MRRILFAAAIAAISSCAFAEPKYIEVDGGQNLPTVRVRTLDDFEAIIKAYGAPLVFLRSDSAYSRGSRASEAFVIAGGACFAFPMEGYRTLADYRAGKAAKFASAEDFYKAVSLGIGDAELFGFYSKNSFRSVEDCRAAREAGYENSSSYYEAQELGCKSPAEYREALASRDGGFQSVKEYRRAKAKGFQKADEFARAKEAGFDDGGEYRTAVAFGLKSKALFEEFEKISSSIERILGERNIDGRSAFVYHLVGKLEKGDMALSALSKSLAAEWEKVPRDVRTALNARMSGCRSVKELQYGRCGVALDLGSLLSAESLKNFFRTVDISRLGSYSERTEIFRRR